MGCETRYECPADCQNHSAGIRTEKKYLLTEKNILKINTLKFIFKKNEKKFQSAT
jgi:hypothetical protein